MLPHIKKVLFATELTAKSRHVFNYALSVAHAYSASIVFLHVLETPAADFKGRICNFLGRDIWDRVDARKKENIDTARQMIIGKLKDHEMLEQALAEINKEACDLVPEQTRAVDEVKIRSGRIAEEILKESDESGCDLIVIGPGSGWLQEKATFSNKINFLMRNSKKPLLIAPYRS